jgi:hypothetical protein
MEQMKQFWVDFVEGRITVPEMLERTDAEPALLDWLTGIAPSHCKTLVVHEVIDEDGWPSYPVEELPFDAKLQIHEYVYRKNGSTTLGKYLNIHGYFSRIMMEVFPEDEIVRDETLGDQFSFMLEACPEYIGGPEVDHLLEELLAQLPQDLSKSKRVKLYKEQVKAMFHVQGSKFPRWIQEAEWPLAVSGKPMRFVEQKRKKGKAYTATMYTQFVFEDVDTGETKIVDQFT